MTNEETSAQKARDKLGEADRLCQEFCDRERCPFCGIHINYVVFKESTTDYRVKSHIYQHVYTQDPLLSQLQQSEEKEETNEQAD